MKIPNEFRHVALHMHQDIELLVQSEDELLEYLANIPPPSDRKVVIDFIDEILGSKLTDKKLGEIWVEAGADWNLRGARGFFERLRVEIVRRGG